MFWPFVVAAFTLSLLLGAVTPIRIVFLALPALVLAVVYWVVVGWNGDAYDIGRSGLVLISAIVGCGFVLIWVVGSVVGRLLRLGIERPPSSRAAGS
jgi:hypothetical protein